VTVRNNMKMPQVSCSREVSWPFSLVILLAQDTLNLSLEHCSKTFQQPSMSSLPGWSTQSLLKLWLLAWATLHISVEDYFILM
jgi:hypothetical protein